MLVDRRVPREQQLQLVRLRTEVVRGSNQKPAPRCRLVEVTAFYQGIFASLFDIELEIHEVVEDGISLGCRFTMHGTHTGELAGIVATGRRIHQPGFTILRFAGDRVVERTSVADFAGVVAQLTGP